MSLEQGFLLFNLSIGIGIERECSSAKFDPDTDPDSDTV
jgi:hypothetical protein